MKRIDLNTSIPHFCDKLSPDRLRYKVMEVMRRADIETVRDLCQWDSRYLYNFRGFGAKSINALKTTISECGLKFNMTHEELSDYEAQWKEDQLRMIDIINAHTVNWEQRRWELATNLLLRCNESDSIKIADEFIRMYKESLNMER